MSLGSVRFIDTEWMWFMPIEALDETWSVSVNTNRLYT